MNNLTNGKFWIPKIIFKEKHSTLIKTSQFLWIPSLGLPFGMTMNDVKTLHQDDMNYLSNPRIFETIDNQILDITNFIEFPIKMPIQDMTILLYKTGLIGNLTGYVVSQHKGILGLESDTYYMSPKEAEILEHNMRVV